MEIKVGRMVLPKLHVPNKNCIIPSLVIIKATALFNQSLDNT
jgi:hypothetical protein